MSFKKLLILFILSQFLLNRKVLAQCNGQKCSSGCKICECSTNNCKNFCKCPSIGIPGNLQLEQTPQFIFLSFNGALSNNFYNQTRFIEKLILNKNISDQNGCRIRPSFYIINDESDYKHISFFANFGKIGLHSVTSKTNVDSNINHWSAEFQVGKELLTKYSSINNNSIIMARPPNSYFNNNYYKQLNKFGIQIDSSIAENPYPSFRTWPYTLDWGYHNQKVCSESDPLRQCLSTFSEVEGIWEFVIPKFYDKEKEGKTFDLNEFNGDFEKAKNILKTNFLENYNTNRAPFGINFDPKWFLNYMNADERKMQFVIDFYQWMGQHENVLFADEEMIINWVKNPANFEITKNRNYFNCPDDEGKLQLEENPCNNKNLNFCEDFNGRASYHICGNQCPKIYPNIRNKTCGDNFCQLGIEDCTCSDCKSFSPCHDSWPGWGRFRIYEKKFDEYNHYVCGDIIYNNPTDKQAIEMVITLNVYQGEIFLINGGKKVELVVDERKEFWKIKKYKFKPYLTNQILSKTNYSQVSLCVEPETENFDDDFIQVGIQFFPNFFNASESFENLNLKCGDGICSSEERLLCNTDCSVSFEGLCAKHFNIKLIFACILYVWVFY